MVTDFTLTEKIGLVLACIPGIIFFIVLAIGDILNSGREVICFTPDGVEIKLKEKDC